MRINTVLEEKGVLNGQAGYVDFYREHEADAESVVELFRLGTKPEGK